MNNKVLSLYDWFLIVGVIASNVIYSMMTGTLDVLGSLAGITGVLCVVLVAKGSIWNYLFGLVNVSLYAYISYKASLYGDAVLNAFYYVPMQFIGWWQWRKRGAAVSDSEAGGGGVQVKATKVDTSVDGYTKVSAVIYNIQSANYEDEVVAVSYVNDTLVGASDCESIYTVAVKCVEQNDDTPAALAFAQQIKNAVESN